MKQNGFTLIELMVSISVIMFLSSIVLFSVIRYVNTGKDAGIKANLSVLIPTGETYYNIIYQQDIGYSGFCQSTVIINMIKQLPSQPSLPNCSNIENGMCCNVSPSGNSWAACAKEFTDPNKAFCVDSKGVKKDIPLSACTNIIYQCP